jgi:hypothetical protein
LFLVAIVYYLEVTPSVLMPFMDWLIAGMRIATEIIKQFGLFSAVSILQEKLEKCIKRTSRFAF